MLRPSGSEVNMYSMTQQGCFIAVHDFIQSENNFFMKRIVNIHRITEQHIQVGVIVDYFVEYIYRVAHFDIEDYSTVMLQNYNHRGIDVDNITWCVKVEKTVKVITVSIKIFYAQWQRRTESLRQFDLEI